MTTDTAVRVTRMVVHDKSELTVQPRCWKKFPLILTVQRPWSRFPTLITRRSSSANMSGRRCRSATLQMPVTSRSCPR